MIRSSTELANVIPRVFMDDTMADRAAIQAVTDQIVAYPLEDFDGTMKSMDWSAAPEIPGQNRRVVAKPPGWCRRSSSTSSAAVFDTVAPLPGEEALYAQFRALLDAAEQDPAVKQALVEAAVETERDVTSPFFAWHRNGRPAGNGWNRSTNNAQFGVGYFDRPGTQVEHVRQQADRDPIFLYRR